ncbi:MAG TPA: DUF4399 domain-containing protein [Actinomycetota bacterium]|nr:DUF4399 domain-containing protein [Actinomycetota bacterium]
MKSGSKMAVLATALLLIAGACIRDDPTIEGSPKAGVAAVEITSPRQGARLNGNVVGLDLEAQGITIKAPDGDTSGRTGHFHVFVDKPAVAVGEPIPMERGVIHSATDRIPVPGLSVGRHKLTVVLGDGAHTRITDELAEVEVDVAGPSVRSTAPAEAPAATGFNVETEVEGVQLAPAATDTGAPGTTGHLHLIIDPPSPPAADGQPIPNDPTHIHTAERSHRVTGLAPGQHTIWVVLGDKAHVPFNPLVADRVVVTVR